MFDKSTKGKILFIRHGETDYNLHLNNSSDKKIIQSNEKYLDCSLSEEGLKQAKSLGEKIEQLKINTIFCSPLNRCIETISIALKNHPEKNNIKIRIHPLITEIVHGAQDLTKSIKEKKEYYENNENNSNGVKLDWSLFDEYFDDDNSDYYFLEYIDNMEKLENLKEQFEIVLKLIKSQFSYKEGLFSQLLSLFLDNSLRPESLSHLFNRANKFKEFLKKYKEEYYKQDDNEEEKILVITHSAFIRMSTTIECNIDINKLECYPSDCYRPENCEIISINL